MTNHGHIPTLGTWWRFGQTFRPILDHAKHGKFSSFIPTDNGLNAVIGSLGRFTARKTGCHKKGKSWDFSLWWLLRSFWHSREVIAQQDKKTVRGSDYTISAAKGKTQKTMKLQGRRQKLQGNAL